MSLHKAIKYGKEHRVEYGTKDQPYCKAVDPTCRNHGTCLWCEGNRLYQSDKLDEETKSKINELYDEMEDQND